MVRGGNAQPQRDAPYIWGISLPWETLNLPRRVRTTRRGAERQRRPVPGLSRELGDSQVEALLPTGMAALSLCNQEKDNPKPGNEDSGKAPLPYVGAQIYSKFLVCSAV